MSNGAAAWLCKHCKGPDQTPWRNWADKERCHKCKLRKVACHLKDVPKSGSPTKSVRQGRGGGSGGSSGKGSGISAAQPAAPDAAAKKRIEEFTREAKAREAKLLALEAKLREAGGMEVDTPDPRDDFKALRSEISHLEQATGPLAEAALAEKRALLLARQAAAREAKPLDTRAKDIERFVEVKKKAVAKQELHVADLKAKLQELEEDLAAAQAKDLQLREDLAKAEAEKVDILHRVAAEAAAEANVVGPQPVVLMQGLASLEKQLQLGHCAVAGVSAEQLQAVLAAFAALLQGPGSAPHAAAAGSAGAAFAPAPPLQVQSTAALPSPAPLPVAGAAPVPTPVQLQSPEVPVQAGGPPATLGGTQAAGGPAASEGEAADTMGEQELLALGASHEAIEGWKAVTRLQRGRGQRSGPYGEA